MQGIDKHCVTDGISIEYQLLLAISRVELRDVDVSRLSEALSNQVDWALVHELARHQRLSGLLHHHVAESSDFQVPEPHLSNLRSDRTFLVAKSAFFNREIKLIVDALSAEQIPIILLKGSALRNIVFGDPSLRPMSDIDILVPEESAQSAQTIVQQLGYEPTASVEDQARAELVGRHLPRLQGIGKPSAVEIHRHIVSLDSPQMFDISGFWERAVPIDLDGRQTKILGWEDQLIHLSLGFILDRRFKSASALGQLTDIHAVIEHAGSEIDWQRLIELLREYRLTAPVGCAITLAHEMLETTIPTDVLPQLWPENTTVNNLIVFAHTRILTLDSAVATGLIPSDSNYDARSLLHSMFNRLFPGRTYMISKYGDSARGILGIRFYFVRLLEAAGIFGRGITRRKDLRTDFAVDHWMHSLLDKS